MDLSRIIQELYEERERLDQVIRSLEALIAEQGLQLGAVVPESRPRKPGRRGRRSMSPEERQVVSARMRKYWEHRRAQ